MKLMTTGAVVACAAIAQTAYAQTHPTDEGVIELGDFSFFFAGGEWVERDGGTYIDGAMYVENWQPPQITQAHPVVMVHGTAQTGSNFTATPDGRRGWVFDFLRAGYDVYVVDQPGRARSGVFSEVYGPTSRFNRETISNRFTAGEDNEEWPTAALHTQWPGNGRDDDTYFNHFASQVESIAGRTWPEIATTEAMIPLLEEIGPAILLMHSQSGPYAYRIADLRSDLVAGIVNVEPTGPPFHNVRYLGAPDWFEPNMNEWLPWGITANELQFDPPAASPEEMNPVLQDEPDGPNLARCFLQGEPARQLPNLQGIPIAIVTGEASHRAGLDHCSVRFLEQAGVEAEHIRLEEHGVTGNAHMMMLELNNHEIADVILEWIDANVE